jgi:hypothetical protein
MRGALLIALALLMSMPAQTYAQRRGGQAAVEGQVVHSRRAPVVLHRAVPPFRGVHVYQGRR